jgi:PAS domain S-box-containing protein
MQLASSSAAFAAPPQSPALPILVVDDDNSLIRTLADILRIHGYETSTANTGARGLELAELHPPALAVVDLRLPDMDGVDLAARLHELSELTQVVVLTGNASVESAVAAMRQHSVDYLLKPVKVEELLRVASVATERFQRRRAEVQLRESDERFRRVVESDMLGIMFWDELGKVHDANDAYLRMVGYSREELDAGAIDWVAMTPPEFVELDQAKVAELRFRGSIRPYEKEYVRKDGSRVPVLIGGAVLQGRTDRGVCFALDISEQKAAERALELRARQQAAVAEFGQRALGKDDPGALVEAAVAKVAETLQLPMCAILERRADGSLVRRAATGWSAKDIPVGDEPALRALGAVSGTSVEIPGTPESYGILIAHDRRPRAFTRDDEYFLQAIAHIVGTAIQRNRTDIAFRQSQRLEAVGRLASGVAHDFNNMLTAITGYAEMVRATLAAGSSPRADMDQVLKAAERAAGLTKQLLAFSRQQVLQPRPVQLNDVVKDMEKMIHRLISEDIELATSLAADLGWTTADPGQIEQVILNLCVNARDAMPNGGRLLIETINTALDGTPGRERPAHAAGEYVMLAVTDNGVGMGAETRARIYEPFFSTKGDKGTGLGLATVYGIVKQSGGEIWVYSEPGQGTSFKVYLPRIEADSARRASGDRLPVSVRGTETVLIAEDDDSVRRISGRILESAGYHVISTASGPDALSAAAAHASPIHLLLTDMIMPGMKGSQLAETLQARLPGLRVLYLSGYTDTAVVTSGLLHSSAQFLQKPFSSDQLLRKVRGILDGPAERH